MARFWAIPYALLIFNGERIVAVVGTLVFSICPHSERPEIKIAPTNINTKGTAIFKILFNISNLHLVTKKDRDLFKAGLLGKPNYIFITRNFNSSILAHSHIHRAGWAGLDEMLVVCVKSIFRIAIHS